MSKTAVIYWSGTGNTEAMAKLVAEGAGAELFTAGEFSVASLPEYSALALGCPAMGAEELDDGEFGPLFESMKAALAGKRTVLFGSYGWGDGEWMRKWEADCREAGIVIAAEPVIAMDAPDADAQAACRKLGELLAAEA